MISVRIVLGCCLLLLGLPNSCLGHKPSDSYLRIELQGDSFVTEWDIALKDLEILVGLDADQDGNITWRELRHQRQAIVAHAISRIQFTADGVECCPRIRDLLVCTHSDGAYAVLLIDTNCPPKPRSLKICYSLLFDVDPTHRGLILFNDGQQVTTHILSPNANTVEIRPGRATSATPLAEFFREGIWHIWIGFDHILFLLTLLAPAVVVSKDGTWRSVPTFRPAWTSVLKVVTMFTLAHSITLWLAVMQYVTIPGSMVESAIAFSIIVSACLNLFRVSTLPSWTVAFGFGLIHGFGFANVLSDLGLRHLALASSLLGFNLGVEVGQLAIVLVVLPLLFLLRDSKLYHWGILRGGSVLVAVVAAVWMYERILNVEILPF